MQEDSTKQAGAMASHLEESVWIEIIQRMEALYAQLANSQAEIEKRADELAVANEFADNIIRSMSSALIAVDSGGAVTMINDATEALFGYTRDALVGGPLDRLLPPGQEDRWSWPALSRRMRLEGPIHGEETTWQSRPGAFLPVSVSCSPLSDRFANVTGAVLVVTDLREAKRRIAEAQAATAAARARARELEDANAALQLLQDELVRAAKMSSLGRLAAGVAHELNNPLGGILLYSDLLLEDTAESDPRRSNLTKIAQLAARCREIVRGLLDFARPAESRESNVDVHALLRSTLAILEGQEVFHNVTVDWRLCDEAPRILAAPAQLQQAFTNIFVNAVEAMDGNGTLVIETARGALGSLVVKVSDTGCGISPEDVEHLFEPFFTRKDDGTGLGLAITYGIVERHGGDIEVESAEGKGTTFTVTLRGSSSELRDT